MDKEMVKTGSTNMTFLLPLDLKQKFTQVCAENDINASQKIRQLMKWYIKMHQENGETH